MTKIILIICGLMWLPYNSGSTPECTSPTSASFKFSLLSTRNNTGEWTAELQAKQGAAGKDAGPWHMDIDHTKRKCEGKESINIFATVTVPPPKPKRQRRGDYELIPGRGFYKMHTPAKTWDQARRICLEEEAYLLILNSVEEWLAVNELWKKNSKTKESYNNYMHVGLSRMNGRKFVTHNGETLASTGYEFWDKNEPRNLAENESCLSVRDNGKLNVQNCENKYNFFCEQDL